MHAYITTWRRQLGYCCVSAMDSASTQTLWNHRQSQQGHLSVSHPEVIVLLQQRHRPPVRVVRGHNGERQGRGGAGAALQGQDGGDVEPQEGRLGGALRGQRDLDAWGGPTAGGWQGVSGGGARERQDKRAA